MGGLLDGAKLSKAERDALAEKRLRSILRKLTVANARTLEQKISDAGPYGQRIDPHVLTSAKKRLEEKGVIRSIKENTTLWYFLSSTDTRFIEQKRAQLCSIEEQINSGNLRKRVGQALEIAVFRSLSKQDALTFFGYYEGIDEIPDSKLYTKREPPNSISGRAIGGEKNLDFIVTGNGITGGIEVKNTRPWIYPDSDAIKDLLFKCGQLNIVPILIGRRIPFVTFKLMNSCGVIVHQTYRQRYPSADTDLVDSLKDKELFGYHDILQGNQSDARLDKFLHKNLPSVLSEMRERNLEFADLTLAYGSREIGYREFAARVRRRTQGTDEDRDHEERD